MTSSLTCRLKWHAFLHAWDYMIRPMTYSKCTSQSPSIKPSTTQHMKSWGRTTLEVRGERGIQYLPLRVLYQTAESAVLSTPLHTSNPSRVTFKDRVGLRTQSHREYCDRHSSSHWTCWLQSSHATRLITSYRREHCTQANVSQPVLQILLVLPRISSRISRIKAHKKGSCK